MTMVERMAQADFRCPWRYAIKSYKIINNGFMQIVEINWNSVSLISKLL